MEEQDEHSQIQVHPSLDLVFCVSRLKSALIQGETTARLFFNGLTEKASALDGPAVLYFAIALAVDANWWLNHPAFAIQLEADTDDVRKTHISFGRLASDDSYVEEWKPATFNIPLMEFVNALFAVERLFPGLFAATFGSRDEFVVLIRLKLNRARVEASSHPGGSPTVKEIRTSLQHYLVAIAEARAAAFHEQHDTSLLPPLPLTSTLPSGTTPSIAPAANGIAMVDIPSLDRTPSFTNPPPSAANGK